MRNPLLQNRNYITIYALVWGLISFLQFMLLFVYLDIELKISLYDAIIFNLTYGVIGLSFWYMSNFITFENSSPFKLITNHIAASIVASLICLGLSYFTIKNLIINGKYDLFLNNSLLVRFFIFILYYFVIAAFNYVLIYYNNFKEKVLRETELNTLVKEAELTSLKYQINPHFIFNSLNSISSLTISDPKRAQEMTIKLSEFMRKTLSRNDKQTVKLKEELASIKIYLDIERVRFEDKFEFIYNLNDECLEMEVPNMILQPLFENAIKHGVYESIEKVVIEMKCEKIDNYFVISVINDFDPETIPRKGEGIGIRNIQNRLGLIYKQDNLLLHKIENSKFIVKLYIPIENN